MTENWRRKPEISQRKPEMSCVEAIKIEMESAVRTLGEGGRNKDEQVRMAARLTGLSTSTVERLRYRKITRIWTDISDRVRTALKNHVAKQEALLRHENEVLKARLAAQYERLTVGSSDPGFHSPQAEPLRRALSQGRDLDSPVD